MASPIETTWAHAAVLIEVPSGRGTGFCVGRSAGPDQWRVFLVSNKHVLGEDLAKRKALTSVKLHINVKVGDGIVGAIVDYPVTDSNGTRCREHADMEVEVFVIDVTPLFVSRKDIANKFAPEELFALAAKRRELDISAGEEIVTVGYPSGIRQGRTNSPLIRQGIIATRIGEELHEEVPLPGGGVKTRKSRAFLIDGATIPGSSGSPVILKPVTGRHQGNAIVMGFTPPVLLGIMAETRFAPIKVGGGAIPGFAGLGFAFDVETIKEVIDLF